MLQKIAIKMLGDFSVVADGRCVVDATAKLTKPWQLFCYLALNREHVTPSSVLLQELWGGEELADPANVLKNTVYALRRELAGPVKPAESPILFRAGGYCLNGHIKWSVDTERFEQLCEKAERCTGGSEAKMAAWRKAEGAFRGELLPQLAGEVWVMRAARGFTRRYLVSARALCACLAGENAYGELLDASGGYYDLSDDAFLGGLAQAAAASPRRLGVLEEYNLRYYRSDAPMSRFLVFADISSERATLDGLRRTCLLIGGLSFLAFLWVSVLLSKWAVRPVERAWQQQRQFVAAASHELKTPLTVIMTNAELLQDEADEARRSTFSSSILTMSRQMRALIEQMLELARTDSAESHLVLRPVDLSGLTARSLLPFEPLFFEQGLTLISQVDEGITVSGDEEALRRVLEILLDNAQKYSSPGGETQVALHRRGRNHCALTVANQGEPIPPEARRQIFQRFYRADPARSRNGSFGLGLSIAEGIVAQHHGTIDVTCAGGFNRFRVELPCRQE